MGEKWCILRTAGRNTLSLAAALAHDGLEVWTPSEMQRYPGKRARRSVPIMPSFVFANARHLWTLVEMADRPNAGFSVFRHFERFPVITDRDLQGLRDSEKQAIPKSDRPAFDKHDEVMATDGPYSGMPGTVLRCKGGDALVLFGWQKVKISTFILKPNEAYRGETARAA